METVQKEQIYKELYELETEASKYAYMAFDLAQSTLEDLIEFLDERKIEYRGIPLTPEILMETTMKDLRLKSKFERANKRLKQMLKLRDLLLAQLASLEKLEKLGNKTGGKDA